MPSFFKKYIKKEETVTANSPLQVKQELNDEVVAAIGLAINLHLKDVHDYEQTVLTIQKVMRPYSPWSSKIYGLRQIPFKFPRNRMN
jgi:hypothetical protein